MAEDIVSIGIAYDTSQLTAGSRQVQTAMQQLTQAEQQAQTATQALTQSNTQAAQAIAQEGQAAKGSAQATQSMEAAAKQAAQAMGQQLATAVAQAAQAMVQAQREAKKADEELRKAANAAGSLRSAMQSFGQQVGAFALAQVGVQGLQQALGTLVSAFTDLIRTGVQLAQLRQSFTAIAGGAAAGAREFQFVVKTANQLGLSLETVASQYRSLTAATRGTALEGTATRELFVALTNAARAYGLSNEQLGRAIMAASQMASKGKITMEELRSQLGEALPGAVQIMARAMGVTTKQLEDLIGKGLDAAEGLKKLTSQLTIEVPKGAERAGSGIQQLGNEIFLLKGRMAQSGLLPWLDSALGKLAELMRKGRELDEREDRRVERRATREQGTGTPLEELPVKSRDALLAKTRELVDAEKAYAEAQQESGPFGFGKQGEASFLGIKTSVLVARERVDQVKQELAALRVRQTLERQEAQEQQKRKDTYTAQFKDQQDAAAAAAAKGKELGEVYKQNTTDIETLNKSAALSPEILGRATGPLKEQNVLLSERLKINTKALEEATKLIVARPAAMGAPPADLLAKHAALRKAVEDDTAAIERNKDAISEAEKAKTKALHDAEAARKKAEADKKQAQEEEARLDTQQAEEVRRTHFQNFQQLTKLAAQYTSVKAARDADTASLLAASLATSRYAEQAKDLLAVLQASQKTEEKLPELRSQAKASAETLTDLERLQKQLEPRQRRQTMQQELAAKRKEIEALPLDAEGKRFALAQADEKIKEALNTEGWQKWRDFATESLDKVGDAITQFAFHGKLTFKDMVSSIAEDFFQMSLKMLSQSAFSSAGGAAGASGGGGWLDLALKAGSSLLGLFGGGATSGTLPTTEAAYMAQAAAGRFSGRQHGGPAYAGTPYLVGEAGPELFVPRMSGTVLPHGQGGSSPTIVNVHVSGVADAQSFVQSRGAVSRAMLGALAQARQQM
jgi:tape measure domain-containing protein